MRSWCAWTFSGYHEKSLTVDSLTECHEEFVVYLHTREAVGIGTSVDLRRICIQRMRPTVDESSSSEKCESVVTRLVLISCVSDHARMAQDSSQFCF